MWTGFKSSFLSKAGKAMLENRPSVCWVVAMNEGIPLGNLLGKGGIPLHVSIHDDQARSMAPRSRRYRWLAPLMQHSWLRLARRARSVDVVSNGMQEIYSRIHHFDSIICRPHVPHLPQIPAFVPRDNQLRVGHIGSIYSEPEFRCFLITFGKLARCTGKTPVLVLIGAGGLDRIALQHCMGDNSEIEDFPGLDESVAVQHLATCDLVYCMYPFDRRDAFFRQTSLPTKLSTYVQSQRPIFAHTLDDSTLAELLGPLPIATVCSSLESPDIEKSIRTLQASTWDSNSFEEFRSQTYGLHNVTRIQDALLAT